MINNSTNNSEYLVNSEAIDLAVEKSGDILGLQAEPVLKEAVDDMAFTILMRLAGEGLSSSAIKAVYHDILGIADISVSSTQVGFRNIIDESFGLDDSDLELTDVSELN